MRCVAVSTTVARKSYESREGVNCMPSNCEESWNLGCQTGESKFSLPEWSTNLMLLWLRGVIQRAPPLGTMKNFTFRFPGGQGQLGLVLNALGLVLNAYKECVDWPPW